MPRLLPVALALSLLLNAFFVAGFVFRGWIAPLPFEYGTPPPPGARPPGAVDVVANEVNLDDSQRKALQGVLERYSQTRRERYRETQKLREQIVAEYKRSPIDQERLGSLIDKLGDLRADQQKETMRALAQLETQLRPEQRQRMHQVLADRVLNPPWRRPAAPSSERPSQ
jgi:Spy/CpxP family protein refolding chaperone